MRVHWSRRSGTPTRRVAPLSKRARTCARGARRDFTTSSAPLSRCECAAARTYPITRVHWSCAQCVHVSRVGPRGDFVARAWHFGPLISDPTGSSLSRAGAQARSEDPNLAEWARAFQGDDEDEVPLLPAHLEAHWVVLSCEPWNMIVNLAPYFRHCAPHGPCVVTGRCSLVDFSPPYRLGGSALTPAACYSQL